MVESADEPPLSSRNPHLEWAKSITPSSLRILRSSRKDHESPRPKTDDPSASQDADNSSQPNSTQAGSSVRPAQRSDTEQQTASAVAPEGDGTQTTSLGNTVAEASLVSRFFRDVKRIIRSSWINWLLIFVPVAITLGVLVDWIHVEAISHNAVFALNAVAIIPLASLLAYATEGVASKMGDTVGALLNVSFGNAVELIIFIIALADGQVRVVQAAALGSILSNLLLILGMSFVAGGLRYREQLYNSTVSQMSACLLCLSVISLLLPTAFHASFNNPSDGTQDVLKVSRGTSVVLLLVYGIYLVFSLKSHSFMYASTPQHLIDEESHPGVLAEILNSSSSSSDSSSTSDSDSDSSSGSRTTAKKIKRALRRRRRKSVSSSKDAASALSFLRTPSDGTNPGLNVLPEYGQIATGQSSLRAVSINDEVLSGDEADVDRAARPNHRRSTRGTVQSRDFENPTIEMDHMSEKPKRRPKLKKAHRHGRRRREHEAEMEDEKKENVQAYVQQTAEANAPPRHVDFANVAEEAIASPSVQRRPFNLRHISEAVRPAFSSTVFPHHQATARPLAMPLPFNRPSSNPRSPSTPGLRRTSSMPEMIHPTMSHTGAVLSQPSAAGESPHPDQQAQVSPAEEGDPKVYLSRRSSVVLLLATTGLVALCAEFLVGSIDHLISSTNIKQAFIGLIILPLIGNAAEHVTAVTVAAKNKMDLAIGIALGSSIQIAIFVTPLMVILGWIMKTDMSLYFSLFETVSLFASALIVGFLMIDGRSNYLEGALLIAAYVIIAVAAFFYPNCDLSAFSGAVEQGHCP